MFSNVKKCGEHDKIGFARDLAGSLTKIGKKRQKTVEIDEKVVKIKKKAFFSPSFSLIITSELVE